MRYQLSYSVKIWLLDQIHFEIFFMKKNDFNDIRAHRVPLQSVGRVDICLELALAPLQSVGRVDAVWSLPWRKILVKFVAHRSDQKDTDKVPCCYCSVLMFKMFIIRMYLSIFSYAKHNFIGITVQIVIFFPWLTKAKARIAHLSHTSLYCIGMLPVRSVCLFRSMA